MSEDAKWPRASAWLKPVAEQFAVSQSAQELGKSSGFDLAVFGVKAHLTSISSTNAHETPAAIRAALQRYSLWSWQHNTDLSKLVAADFGDIENPDTPEGEAETARLTARALESAKLAIALGGDNSITYAVAKGAADFLGDISQLGVITLDAHHDLRDGVSNGSPIRRLVEFGVDPTKIVQIGIADFSNSPEYAALAKDLGITVISRAELRSRSPKEIWRQAIEIAGRDGAKIHVDFDVDVCDRAVVPACPAAAPGGISADELRQFAYLAGNSQNVVSVDITEIDATVDAADQRTVRLAALLILEAAAGLANRA